MLYMSSLIHSFSLQAIEFASEDLKENSRELIFFLCRIGAQFRVAVFAFHTVQSSSFYKVTANKHNTTTTLQECVNLRGERYSPGVKKLVQCKRYTLGVKRIVPCNVNIQKYVNV